MKKSMLYLGIFILGFVIVSLWSFWIVVRPPRIILERTPADFNLPADEVTITSEDGLKLSAWLIHSMGSMDKAIILLHGYPAEKSDMLFIASSLYPDFSLLLLDLRYFGESEGKLTTFGIRERGDIKKVINYLESRGYSRIGIFGFSLGGAVGILTGAEDTRVRAISSYASYADLRVLGRELYRNLLVLKYPLVELIHLWGLLAFGESFMEVSPENAARTLNVPVFLIHSKEDEQIPFTHAVRLQDALSKNKNTEFYFIETGLHGELPLDFNSRLKDFFTRVL